jgi:DNA-directed RNA polymerase subunit RPC12/RpoP
MKSCPCPSCGTPLPVTVASLHGVRCRSCGFEGPPPPEVVQRLQVAQRELTRLDVRARQFDLHARAAIGRALRVRWGVIVALAVGGLPFLALGAGGLVLGVQHEGPIANRVAGILMISVPMVVYATAGCLLHWRVVSARNRLLAACAAVPPLRLGEAAACAMCGAPLVSRGIDPVVRCDHCGADNVVHPSAMAQASAKKNVDLDALTVTLGRSSEAIVATARRVSLATVALVFGTPFVGFVSGVVIFLCAARLEPLLQVAPSDLHRYAWVDTSKGRCVGLIAHDGHETLAYFGDNDRLPNPSTMTEGSPELPRFAAGALVGERVRTSNGAEGIVRRVLGSPITNREVLVLDTGVQGQVPGSCAASH